MSEDGAFTGAFSLTAIATAATSVWRWLLNNMPRSTTGVFLAVKLPPKLHSACSTRSTRELIYFEERRFLWKWPKGFWRGELLGPESCGWHYVEGLTKNDDPRLALLWDKEGLGHFGQRSLKRSHCVILCDGTPQTIEDQDWESFLERQKALMANRDDAARSGGPILVGKIHLPSGETVDNFNGSWQLEWWKGNATANSSGATSSGPRLQPSTLWWFKGRLEEGTTTYVLSFPDYRLRSRPVRVKVTNGKVSAQEVIFYMEKSQDGEPQ